MSSESEPELVGEWREFTVQDPPVDAEGNDLSRVDRWLHQHFPRLSRSLLQKYIQDGRVHVDGAIVKPSFALKLGHRVKFCVPPPRRKLPIPQDIPLEVIHEDDDLIVIAKPAGLVVHGSPGVAEAGSLVNALLNHTDQLSQEAGTYRPGIVHRLDRETSGVIIVARNDTAHRHVGDQFRARTVAKEYVAFSHGVPKESEGEVDLPLGRSPATPRKRTVRYDSEGKEARTRWRAEASRGGFTRFRLFPSPLLEDFFGVDWLLVPVLGTAGALRKFLIARPSPPRLAFSTRMVFRRTDRALFHHLHVALDLLEDRRSRLPRLRFRIGLRGR